MMRHKSLIRLIPKTFMRRISISAKMNGNRRIAVCQMTSVADKNANFEIVKKLIEDSSKEGVKMIFLPEACDYIADNKKDMLESSEPIPGGNLLQNYRKLASKHNVWLSVGGIHEKDESNPSKNYNVHVIIDNQGTIVQTYRKLHMFDVEIPEKNVRLKESDFNNSGDHIVTPVTTPVGKIGMAICYDMRFPELSCQLGLLGAEVLTFPSAFTHATGEAHWEIILRSRAIETQCFVVAAAQVGLHNKKRRSYGRAMIISPWGDILADCGLEDSPSYRIADLSEEKIKEVRTNMPVYQHKRKDVYSLYTLKLRNDMLPEHCELREKNEDEQDRIYEGPTNVFGHVRVPKTCIFYQSQLNYAFVNLRCVIPGHVLVAPLRPAERNNDLTEDEATDFYKTIRIVQKLMEKVHQTDSCTVTIQDGVDAGQTVKHLHCHIMPRKKGDFIENDLIYLELRKNDQLQIKGHPGKPARSLKEMEEEAAMLRKELETLLSHEHHV